MHFSSLLTLAGTVALAAAAPSNIEKRANNFQFFGVSESGAEFGEGTIPGTLGKQYIWPDNSAIDVLNAKGMNTFRVAFLMERLVPDKLTGGFAAAYLADLKSTVSHITSKGAYAVLDPHNYARYYGNVITDVDGFKTWWTNVASQFKDNDKVVFDCNNEPHDMPSMDLVVKLNQACINGIRAAGANSQYIFVEGTSWSGAWSWTTSGNTALSVLTDPQDKIVYEMHQYLDSDSSGTNEACVSTTIGVERVKAATEWLRANGKKGLLGEFAGGPNAQCKQAVEGLLAYLYANSDVWTGALWWAAGPWWDTYMFSLEAPNGKGYTYYMDTLQKYAGDGKGSGPAVPTTVAPTSTAPKTTAPAITSTKTTSTKTTSTAAVPSTPAGNVQAVAKWGQCGGIGYAGSTVCVAGSTCTVNNDWYSQCL